MKDARPQELARAVRTAHAGEALLDPVVAAQLVETLASDGEPLDRLTPREREVLELVVSGLLNKQVAAELGISEITIKVHRAQVMQKMQAESLADLVRMSEKLGVPRGKKS